MSIVRTLTVGSRPRTTAIAAGVALLATAAPVLGRLAAPAVVPLVPVPVVLAGVGGLVAVAIGRRRGGVLAAVACVWLPVTAADLAATALDDPFTASLVVRVLPERAWTGLRAAVAVAIASFTVGGWARTDDAWSTHLRTDVDVRGLGLAAGGVAVAVVAAAAWALATGRPTAFAPVPVGVGLVVATGLGVRAPGVALPALVGWSCVATAIASFAVGFGPGGGLTARDLAVVLLAGGVGGVPVGAVGYAAGRVLAVDLPG